MLDYAGGGGAVSTAGAAAGGGTGSTAGVGPPGARVVM